MSEQREDIVGGVGRRLQAEARVTSARLRLWLGERLFLAPATDLLHSARGFVRRNAPSFNLARLPHAHHAVAPQVRLRGLPLNPST